MSKLRKVEAIKMSCAAICCLLRLKCLQLGLQCRWTWHYLLVPGKAKVARQVGRIVE